jgi:signal transduction histidine kinase
MRQEGADLDGVATSHRGRRGYGCCGSGEKLPDELRPQREELRETARQLRPVALEELGLPSALGALTNIARHADATKALLELQCMDEHTVLRVCDDGRGVARVAAVVERDPRGARARDADRR